jgi:hypothetical protein
MPRPKPIRKGLKTCSNTSRPLQAYVCRIYGAAFRASIPLCTERPARPGKAPLSASCSSDRHFACGILPKPYRDRAILFSEKSHTRRIRFERAAASLRTLGNCPSRGRRTS